MARLKAVYETEAEIPEGLGEYYKEQADGSFKIELSGGVKTQADVDRAMAAMEKQKQLRIELEKKLSNYPDDFDTGKWDKVKDIDPDNLPTGGSIDKDSKEFQNAVAQVVREKEKEYKEELDSQYNSKFEEVTSKEQRIIQDFKENWIKQFLAEKFGFNDPKRLRWLMLDIKAGQHPDLKKKLETIKVDFDGDKPKVVGGDLKDEQGALEVLENIASSEVSKDYKPAADNSGGGTPPNGGGGGGGNGKIELFKKNDKGQLVGNRTERGKLIREKPDEARKLAKQAGWSEREINW